MFWEEMDALTEPPREHLEWMVRNEIVQNGKTVCNNYMLRYLDH